VCPRYNKLQRCPLFVFRCFAVLRTIHPRVCRNTQKVIFLLPAKNGPDRILFGDIGAGKWKAVVPFLLAKFLFPPGVDVILYASVKDWQLSNVTQKAKKTNSITPKNGIGKPKTNLFVYYAIH